VDDKGGTFHVRSDPPFHALFPLSLPLCHVHGVRNTPTVGPHVFRVHIIPHPGRRRYGGGKRGGCRRPIGRRRRATTPRGY